MKLLLLCTRSLDGPQTGRKTVLRTIVSSCRALGHDVSVAVVGPVNSDGKVIAIPTPGPTRIALNVLSQFLWGGKSLNECLFWSRAAQARVAQLVQEGAYDLVIADMVRTAQFCTPLNIPWVLDMDDLLSDRYERQVMNPDNPMILGYFAQRLPAALRSMAARVARSLLSVEARRLRRCEAAYAAQAAAVTLVSPIEARILAKRLGREVHDTAMVIDAPASVAGDYAARADDAVVFVGGLDYQPNLDAVRHFVDAVAPAGARAGESLCLHVIGNAPAELRPADAQGRVHYLGYVDDLAAALACYRVFAAPIVSGSGIKTKVLEAMAHGLAVVATPGAVAGLRVKSDVECLVAPTPPEFAAAVQTLLRDPGRCAAMGSAARRFVVNEFSAEVVRDKWRALLALAVAPRALENP